MWLLLAASGTAYACSDDPRPAISDDTSPSDAGTTTSDARASGGGGGVVGFCALLPADAGAPVEAEHVAGTAPAATGGEFAKGTYLLTKIQVYGATGAPETKQGFLSFDAVVFSSGTAHMEVVGQSTMNGVTAPTTWFGGTWEQDVPTSLHVRNTCQDNIADLAYSSTLSSFTVHDGNRLETYTLTP